MKKEIIDKIKCEDESERIEIFCNQRYKDYYVRGNFVTISDYVKVHNQRPREYSIRIDYRFLMVVLVNDVYLKRTEKDMITNDFRFRDSEFEWNTGNMFRWRNQREYVNERKKWLLARPKELEKSGRRILEWEEEIFKKETLVIELDEVGIVESPYLNESIGTGKQIILADIDFFVHDIDLSHCYTIENYYARIYTIPAFYCTGEDREFGVNYGVPHWFDKLYEFLYFNLDYDCLEKREYSRILKSIGDLSLEWIHKNTIDNPYLKKLNQLNKKIGNRTYPLSDFCWKFLDDLVDDLMTQKQIRECQFCGDFFIYNPGVAHKKFCSLMSEGKDCGKKTRYRRWYEKHKSENRAKSRKEMRETRALYKEHGL